MKQYYVYMMASKKNGTLYTGVTNDLLRRVWEHKEGLIEGFTEKYNVKTLVWYESTADIKSAIAREKCIKAWKRAWKIRLITENNHDWHDLYLDMVSETDECAAYSEWTPAFAGVTKEGMVV